MKSFMLMACAFLVSSAAFAAAESKSYVGGLVGASVPDIGGSNSDNQADFTFGMVAGVKLIPELGVGFFGTYFGQNHSVSFLGLSAGTSTRALTLAGELNFFVSIVHIGVDLGAAINTWSARAGSLSTGTSRSTFVYGPVAGVDIPLGKSALSLGVEAHYLISSQNDGTTDLQAFGALKAWF